MGLIIGKFRKKKSTYEVLEKLENQITSIEEFGRSTEQFRKKIIGRFVFLAVLLYLILSVILYYYYHNISSDQRFIYIIPVIAFPLIIWIIKKILTWYYSRKLRKNEKKLIKLREEKKKLLDNVMETETYKVAKKILDKFGNEPAKVPQLTLSGSTPITSREKSTVSTIMRLNPPGLRQRTVGPPTVRGRLSFGSTVSPTTTPYPERTFIQSTKTSTIKSTSQLQALPIGTSGTPLPLPRSILPRDRSVLDKMIHFLIGDGPENRYALICRQCSTHNGMAFKEDFEYLSFRCCYCSYFNPAKKQRPVGPQLEITSSSKTMSSDSSESDKSTIDSDDEDDVSPKPVVRNDTPDTEKNSDFDKLSDLDAKETVERMEQLQGGSGDAERRGVEDQTASTEEVEEIGHHESPMDVSHSDVPMDIDTKELLQSKAFDGTENINEA